MDPLRTYFDALRVLAKTRDPNRVVLIKRNIDRYLQMESGEKERGLERLRVAISLTMKRPNGAKARIGA